MQWSFTPHPQVLSECRAQVRAAAAVWELTDDAVDVLELITDELAANAVDHARTPFRVTLRHSEGVVWVLVRDYSSRAPDPQPLDPWAPRGRGLYVVAMLASRWGWGMHELGKTVWATVVCDPGVNRA